MICRSVCAVKIKDDWNLHKTQLVLPSGKIMRKESIMENNNEGVIFFRRLSCWIAGVILLVALIEGLSLKVAGIGLISGNGESGLFRFAVGSSIVCAALSLSLRWLEKY